MIQVVSLMVFVAPLCQLSITELVWLNLHCVNASFRWFCPSTDLRVLLVSSGPPWPSDAFSFDVPASKFAVLFMICQSTDMAVRWFLAVVTMMRFLYVLPACKCSVLEFICVICWAVWSGVSDPILCDCAVPLMIQGVSFTVFVASLCQLSNTELDWLNLHCVNAPLRWFFQSTDLRVLLVSWGPPWLSDEFPFDLPARKCSVLEFFFVVSFTVWSGVCDRMLCDCGVSLLTQRLSSLLL